MSSDDWRISYLEHAMLDRVSKDEMARVLRCTPATANWFIRKTPQLAALRAEYTDARRRMRGKRVTAQGLMTLLKAGKSPAQCAVICGCNISTIYRRIRQFDELQEVFEDHAKQREPRSREERDAIAPKIKAMLLDGARHREIRTALDLTPSQLIYILNENPEMFEGLRGNRPRKVKKTTKKLK